MCFIFCFFKQKTAYEMRISDWSSDVCSSDLLWAAVEGHAGALSQLGVARGERIGVWLDKRFETIIAFFGASLAGAVFVPINPVLRPPPVHHILTDCTVRVLITSRERQIGRAHV